MMSSGPRLEYAAPGITEDHPQMTSTEQAAGNWAPILVHVPTLAGMVAVGETHGDGDTIAGTAASPVPRHRCTRRIVALVPGR
jgi:hypothetical protein